MARLLNRFIIYPAIAGFTASKVQACGIALALAVDVSGSVTSDEYRVQIDGLAAALRDTVVAEALLAENARVMLVQWTGSNRQVVSVPWHKMDTAADVDTFADKVAKVPRAWKKYSTAIGDVLIFTANQFDTVSGCTRKVIDVSGDGYSNEGVPPEDVRAGLVQAGFVINGLAIEGSADALTAYYRDHVIAGDNAFVMTANSFDAYPVRIRQKLLREIGKLVAMIKN